MTSLLILSNKTYSKLQVLIPRSLTNRAASTCTWGSAIGLLWVLSLSRGNIVGGVQSCGSWPVGCALERLVLHVLQERLTGAEQTVLKHSNVVALTPRSPKESRESSESIIPEFQVHDIPGFHGERKASKISLPAQVSG